MSKSSLNLANSIQNLVCRLDPGHAHPGPGGECADARAFSEDEYQSCSGERGVPAKVAVVVLRHPARAKQVAGKTLIWGPNHVHIPQGLKPGVDIAGLTARLKSCPVTKPQQTAAELSSSAACKALVDFGTLFGTTEVVPCYKITSCRHFSRNAGASLIFIFRNTTRLFENRRQWLFLKKSHLRVRLRCMPTPKDEYQSCSGERGVPAKKA
jgi:hypothetical protein